MHIPGWPYFGHLLPKTTWYCPVEGCGYDEKGYPLQPIGNGKCKQKKSDHQAELVKRVGDEPKPKPNLGK